MLIRPLQFVVDYVNGLNASLKQISTPQLSKTQRRWLVIVLMGIIVTGKFNWAGFERRSLGEFKESRLRWIFNHAAIAWEHLLQASISHVLKHYDLSKGVLVLDDSDKTRSRNTTKIHGVHKVKDKKTGGWFRGQEFVFLILVTDTVTIPVGFRFYNPDPAIKEWKKKVKEQKKAGIAHKNREPKPSSNPDYPSKKELALKLLQDFHENHLDFKVQAVLADALYGYASFMDKAAKITSCSQVISQLRRNQLVRTCGKSIPLTTYFSRTSGVTSPMKIRGGKEQNVTMIAARLVVKSHGKKRFVIALKYEGETEYRFIVATDLTWRHKDVMRTYTLRWLIEVFFEDWKGHCGWNSLSKQQGADSATQGVTLSLLCDHLLILHPHQSARLKDKKPALPVGCIVEHINAQALIDGVKQIVYSSKPKHAFEQFKNALEGVLPERKSTKHLVGLDLGRMEPTPSLRYQKAA